MKTLTLDTLKAKSACLSQREVFKRLFGESVVVTESLCLSVAGRFDWVWASENILSAYQLGLYNESVEPAQKLYDESMGVARKLYDELMESERRLYYKSRESARKLYDESRESAQKLYYKSRESAQKLYDETKAISFAYAYNS